MNEPASGVPVMLDVRGRKCVVVGGGGVGARRARALSEAGARVVVIALQVHPSVKLAGVQVIERAFEPSDLDHALLVVAATDIPEINDVVADAAAERGVLVNRADDSGKGQLQFMCTHRDGPLTLAVHSGGASASAATQIRDLIASQLDPDWARLLSAALPIRQQIQDREHDPAKRTGLLRRLTDDQAMQTLKTKGEAALRAFYDDIMKDLA